MENPIVCDTFKSDNPTISSTYSKNAQKLVESMAFSEVSFKDVYAEPKIFKSHAVLVITIFFNFVIKGDIVMNYGCGSGKFMSEFLFPKIPSPRCICGVDVSPQMIRFAYENCKDKNFYFASGDIMNKYQWTFKENMVNKFVAYLVLCYVQDYR